jgi:phytoene synthase
MNPSIPPHLTDAYRRCLELASQHYENFPVASLFLPKESRPHIAALYAFARTADDFADEPSPQSSKKNKKGYEPHGGEDAITKRWRLREINRWEKGLRDSYIGRNADPVLQAFAHTLRAFQIPLALPLDLLKAFRMDVSQHRYSTWNSLYDYCRHSANPVGRMVLLISGIKDPAVHRYSDSICTGLQLTNFWQDTSLDMARGRIYYPKSEWKKAGVSEKDLLALKWSPASRQLVRNAVNSSEVFFQQGLPLLNHVGGRLRWELKATILGGQGILKKIRAMDYNVFQGRPSWSAWEKTLLAFQALFGPTHI